MRGQSRGRIDPTGEHVQTLHGLALGAEMIHMHWDGVRDALAYGASSAQPDRGITIIPEPVIPGDNELNLNVFTPELGAAGLPVLVWIHGGGYFGGVQRLPVVPGRGLRPGRGGAGQHQLPARRAGLPGGAGRPGQPGRAGLGPGPGVGGPRNITAFGGDPAKVTIAGQSAGGGACAALTGRLPRPPPACSAAVHLHERRGRACCRRPRRRPRSGRPDARGAARAAGRAAEPGRNGGAEPGGDPGRAGGRHAQPG